MIGELAVLTEVIETEVVLTDGISTELPVMLVPVATQKGAVAKAAEKVSVMG